MSNNQTTISKLSEQFGALANPNRLALLLKLVDCCGDAGSCSTNAGLGACVGDLSKGLGIAPPTVSHHLKELRRTGLISMSRRGRYVECCINAEALRALARLIDIPNHKDGLSRVTQSTT